MLSMHPSHSSMLRRRLVETCSWFSGTDMLYNSPVCCKCSATAFGNQAQQQQQHQYHVSTNTKFHTRPAWPGLGLLQTRSTSWAVTSLALPPGLNPALTLFTLLFCRQITCMLSPLHGQALGCCRPWIPLGLFPAWPCPQGWTPLSHLHSFVLQANHTYALTPAWPGLGLLQTLDTSWAVTSLALPPGLDPALTLFTLLSCC
jgi:hypothetical protein